MQLFFKESGEGFPLILLHGLFGSSDNWLTVTKKLSEKYKVFLVDQRNHGRSPHDETFTYEAMVEDLIQFFIDHNLAEAYIIGHSMGGKVAMNFAVKYPTKVKKLIIGDIGPKFYERHHDAILNGLQSLNLDELENRTMADQKLSVYIPEPEVRQFLLKNLSREGDGYQWRINLPVLSRDIENIGEAVNDSHSFAGPTLFIRGGNSKYIKDEDFELINKIFPDSKVKTIPNIGHWIQAEAPGEFLSLVFEFLDK